MTIASTVSITPGTQVPGAVSNTERYLSQPMFNSAAVRDAFTRATQDSYFDWLHHIRPAAGCTRPIRLAGTIQTIHATTGQLLGEISTADMPDGIIYKPCGNRRSSVCPSCSVTYQNDAYQLLHAGLVGGKGVPESVATHPAVFATFTAPSFGTVHARIIKKHTCANRHRCDCRAEPCHARRTDDPNSGLCEHGRAAVCFIRHETGDARIGEPLCLDCYDHDAHVVWNLFAGELWRRTKQAIDRHLTQTAKSRGVRLHVVTPDGKTQSIPPVRASHGKAAEFQARGAIHFHALIRLDGIDPTDPDAVIPPPQGMTAQDLDVAIHAAAEQVAYNPPAHPVTPADWRIVWGGQVDVQPVELAGSGDISDRAVAGYLAKYATKSTEATGHTSTRITRDNIATFTAEDRHVARLILACRRLSRNPTPLVSDPDVNPYLRLENWAHMLGFGGHFLTKAPRFSTTFGALRAARSDYRREQDTSGSEAPSSVWNQTGDQVDIVDTILMVGTLTYTGTGWHTLGDAMLANTAAAKAREYAITAREEIAAQLRSATHVEPIAA